MSSEDSQAYQLMPADGEERPPEIYTLPLYLPYLPEGKVEPVQHHISGQHGAQSS